MVVGEHDGFTVVHPLRWLARWTLHAVLRHRAKSGLTLSARLRTRSARKFQSSQAWMSPVNSGASWKESGKWFRRRQQQQREDPALHSHTT